MAQSLLQQKVADLTSGALTQSGDAYPEARGLDFPIMRLSGAFGAQAPQFGVYFPCSATKFPASARPIPCLRAAGIRPEIVGFTLNSAVLQQAEHQQSTISLHISLLPGNPAVD
jgi:hypothetical protein